MTLLHSGGVESTEIKPVLVQRHHSGRVLPGGEIGHVCRKGRTGVSRDGRCGSLRGVVCVCPDAHRCRVLDQTPSRGRRRYDTGDRGGVTTGDVSRGPGGGVKGGTKVRPHSE